MQNPFVHRVGGVLSADIAVPDHEREVEFYSSVLTTGDSPLWRDDLMNNQGNPVIGLGVRTPEYDSLPLQWMPHFQVADVAASAASAVELGGQEIMHSKADDGQSQWAVLADQVGAAFGIIPVVAGESSGSESEHLGRISWLSLMSPDAALSRDFYQRVVGWTAKPIEAADGKGQGERFVMQIDDETAAAEICQRGGDSSDVPSAWMIHVTVADFAESLRRVNAAGGEVITECGEAQRAVVRDPVGVYFGLQAG